MKNKFSNFSSKELISMKKWLNAIMYINNAIVICLIFVVACQTGALVAFNYPKMAWNGLKHDYNKDIQLLLAGLLFWFFLVVLAILLNQSLKSKLKKENEIVNGKYQDKDIQFKKYVSKHELTDTEIKQLLAGKSITFSSNRRQVTGSLKPTNIYSFVEEKDAKN